MAFLDLVGCGVFQKVCRCRQWARAHIPSRMAFMFWASLDPSPSSSVIISSLIPSLRMMTLFVCTILMKMFEISSNGGLQIRFLYVWNNSSVMWIGSKEVTILQQRRMIVPPPLLGLSTGLPNFFLAKSIFLNYLWFWTVPNCRWYTKINLYLFYQAA